VRVELGPIRTRLDEIRVLSGVARSNQADRLRDTLLKLNVRFEDKRDAGKRLLEFQPYIVAIRGEEFLGHEALLAATKLDRIARTTSSTLGISSTREMSMVSICGQKGKPRSAITSVFVWRMRLRREFIAGFRMPVFNINAYPSSL
jgi:hypothetical protein